MTFKKVSIITIAGAALLAGAIGISASLIKPNEIEIEVPEPPEMQEENGVKTLENMENMPIYFDDSDVLLLPLRNVLEGLGGSVEWDRETRTAKASYRGRTLAVQPGERSAFLNGYEVTLPQEMEMINGCLYADEKLISTYYTGKVVFNRETRQVSLQAKENTAPLLAVHEISGEQDGKSYQMEVPVIVGLNDSNFEKNLNRGLQEKMQTYLQEYLNEDTGEAERLSLTVQAGMCSGDFLSFWWEGKKNGISVKMAENIDLLGQKPVTLTDMLEETSLAEIKAVEGTDWTEEQFFLTAEGGLVLLKSSNEGGLEMHYWTTEGKPLAWKASYQALFRQ